MKNTRVFELKTGELIAITRYTYVGETCYSVVYWFPIIGMVYELSDTKRLRAVRRLRLWLSGGRRSGFFSRRPRDT